MIQHLAESPPAVREATWVSGYASDRPLERNLLRAITSMRPKDTRLLGVPSVLSRADIVEVELSDPLPDDIKVTQPDVVVLALLCGQPLGMALMAAEDVSSAASLAAGIQTELQAEIIRALPSHGLDPGMPLGGHGYPHGDCSVRGDRETVAKTGPGVSVIVCTRERTDELRRCLGSLYALDYHDFEILVVDNCPVTDATRQLCLELNAARAVGEPVLRYLVENRPGLSYARNTGLGQAKQDLVAFVDDDERVHTGWLAGLAGEFTGDQAVGGVSGIVLPAELQTNAQVLFEQFGGHSKGRGFRRVCFDADYLASVQPAMYPLPPFGVGANMAFTRSAITAIGGFDVALGAGTPLRGGEDTRAFTELLLAGWQMVYTPAAITWHYHRRDDRDLVDQLSGYGLGLGGYYVALVLRDPRRLFRLVRLLPRAVRDLSDPSSPRNASSQRSSDLVPGLDIRAILVGAWRYVRIRIAQLLPRSRALTGTVPDTRS